ncbi:MAG: OmpA family protein [Alphaproteobacteria bacterium]|nr:OmpA family protein [Alphaproteobacteria bacterium]
MKKALTIMALATLTACSSVPSNINDDKVFFAFDSAEITDTAKSDLKSQSLYMKTNRNVNVVLEGHCDERGSTEYNLALGALRAGNAAHVLMKDGIEPRRIKTISYGKEKPQYPGTGEKVWAKNRNVTTKTQTQK